MIRPHMLVPLLAAGLLAGCHTAHGIGQDLSSAGTAIAGSTNRITGHDQREAPQQASLQSDKRAEAMSEREETAARYEQTERRREHAAPTALHDTRDTHRSPAGHADDRLKEAQWWLRDHGLYDGPLDGVSGPKTTEALKDWQHQHNLQATGRLDDNTYNSLKQGG